MLHAALLRAGFLPAERPEDLVLLGFTHKLFHDSHSFGDLPNRVIFGAASSGTVGGERDVQRYPFIRI